MRFYPEASLFHPDPRAKETASGIPRELPSHRLVLLEAPFGSIERAMTTSTANRSPPDAARPNIPPALESVRTLSFQRRPAPEFFALRNIQRPVLRCSAGC